MISVRTAPFCVPSTAESISIACRASARRRCRFALHCSVVNLRVEVRILLAARFIKNFIIQSELRFVKIHELRDGLVIGPPISPNSDDLHKQSPCDELRVRNVVYGQNLHHGLLCGMRRYVTTEPPDIGDGVSDVHGSVPDRVTLPRSAFNEPWLALSF